MRDRETGIVEESPNESEEVGKENRSRREKKGIYCRGTVVTRRIPQTQYCLIRLSDSISEIYSTGGWDSFMKVEKECFF